MITMKALLQRIATAELMDLAEARRIHGEFRGAHGFKAVSRPLFTLPGENTKLAKGGIPNFGLTLSPANLSGAINLCPHATRTCRAVCLNTAGKGKLNTVQRGRLTKTLFLIEHTGAFLTLLLHELDNYTARNGEIGVRLNVLSDIPWERAVPWLFERYPDASFYDYTKWPDRTPDTLPANYRLTYSASERDSDADLQAKLAAGTNVAIVAHKVNGEVPSTYFGHPVVNGDADDHRFNDAPGVAVFLTPKGDARGVAPGGFIRSATGFAVAGKGSALAA